MGIKYLFLHGLSYDRAIKENYGTYAIGTEVQYPDSNNSPEERIETLKHTLSGTLDITNYTYDNLKRLTEKEVSAYYSGTIYRNKYSYHAGKSGTNETTGLIKNEELYLRYSQIQWKSTSTLTTPTET